MILIKTDSLDAKQIIKILDEMHFDLHANGKTSRDKNLAKNYYNKRALLASSDQEVIFLSDNPNEICDRLHLIIQEKQARNDTTRFDNELVAKIDKILEYKSITSTQHKKFIENFNLV